MVLGTSQIVPKEKTLLEIYFILSTCIQVGKVKIFRQKFGKSQKLASENWQSENFRKSQQCCTNNCIYLCKLSRIKKKSEIFENLKHFPKSKKNWKI